MSSVFQQQRSAYRWKTLVCAALAVALWCGCSHHPVYPDYGSALITSDPAGAEILIDGATTRRATPCKLDGLGTGAHTVTLRMWNYRIKRSSVTIRPAQTAHLNVHLEQVELPWVNYGIGGTDFAYDPANQRIYIAGWGTQCLVCAINDTVVTFLYGIELNDDQRLIAASPVTNRVFCLTLNGALAMVDPQAPEVLRWLVLPGMAHYQALLVSPDGNTVVASDSVNRRLVLIDARLGSVLRYISLPGSPGDLLFTPSGTELYVLLPPQRQLIRLNVASGAVQATLATGNAPTGLFWSTDQRSIGFCNRRDNSITLVELAAWSGATGVFSVSGTWGTCASPEADYIFFLTDHSCCYCYLPEWKMTGRSTWDMGQPRRIIASRQHQRYYLLTDWGISVFDAHF